MADNTTKPQWHALVVGVRCANIDGDPNEWVGDMDWAVFVCYKCGAEVWVTGVAQQAALSVGGPNVVACEECSGMPVTVRRRPGRAGRSPDVVASGPPPGWPTPGLG